MNRNRKELNLKTIQINDIKYINKSKMKTPILKLMFLIKI